MTAIFGHSVINLTAVTSVCAAPISDGDELGLARQRMRHLKHWNIKVLPPMHFARATPPTEPLSDEVRKRYQHLAMGILAVHMQNATANSALQ